MVIWHFIFILRVDPTFFFETGLPHLSPQSGPASALTPYLLTN